MTGTSATPNERTSAESHSPRTLILLRHGKAANPGGTVDHQRPLAERGRTEAALTGQWITAHLPAVDAILCSSALRTVETLHATGIEAPTRFTDEIYDASPADILAAVAGTSDVVRTLLVVGHVPGIPALAGDLAGPDSNPQALSELEHHFPTSALAVLEVDDRWLDLDANGARLTAVHVAR